MDLAISEIDSNRFGLKIGRAFDLTEVEQVSEIEKFIKQQSLDCLIVRCSSTETKVIHALEKIGFHLMEGRIRFVYREVSSKLNFPIIPLSENTRIRAGVEDDEIEPLVRRAYAGYKGHYHHNPALDKNECDNVYVDWALNALSNISSENYFSVVEKSSKLIAFASGNKGVNGSFIGGLLAVDPKERKQGLASALHYHRLQWCKEKDFDSVIVATSLNNWTYQNLLIKLGYSVLDTDLTFHWTYGADKEKDK
ncbi:MAG: GNAT family N-acetyltransferase [Methylomicrobium sp.]|nr:GNAT family N-acetyltransferase [Methylomicrobium sp.]